MLFFLGKLEIKVAELQNNTIVMPLSVILNAFLKTIVKFEIFVEKFVFYMKSSRNSCQVKLMMLFPPLLFTVLVVDDVHKYTIDHLTSMYIYLFVINFVKFREKLPRITREICIVHITSRQKCVKTCG